MYRILKIGMDVHTTNYTLCAVEPMLGTEENVLAQVQIEPDYTVHQASETETWGYQQRM